MRMATRHRRRWIGIGGATAAVAIAVWAAVALAAPTGLAITPGDHAPAAPISRGPRGAGDGTGYDVQRVDGRVRRARRASSTVGSARPACTTLDNTPPG